MEALFLNGPVGVGKSTVAAAIGTLESLPHAVLDVDEIRRFDPAPAGDPFNLELTLLNLGAVSAGFRDAGAQRFVLAGVIETLEERERYRAAIDAETLLVVRLTAPPAVIDERLRARHGEDAEALDWHLSRARELTRILEREGPDDTVIDTGAASPQQVAATIRARVGWELG